MGATFFWRSAAVTSTGNVREHNEDAVLELPNAGLWAVADGMGGHAAGDVASRMIVDALATLCACSRFSELVDTVEDQLTRVNERLFRAGQQAGATRGSTVVVLLAFGRYCLSLWAGDSRAYRLRSGTLNCVTHDHSAAQALLDDRILEPNSPALQNVGHVITRAVGGAHRLFLDVELRELADQDRYLLCSDGLYRELSEQRIVLALDAADPYAACKSLLTQALSGACADNVSAVVVQFTRA
jgi:serine/threonine-protein phosphatase Stp1